MPTRLRAAYDKRIQSGQLSPDPAQDEAIAALSRLSHDLKRRGRFGKVPTVTGVYLWGPPGRGKSMLMDLFFACAPEPRKRRAHFHAFMARVHDLIRQWRESDKTGRKAVFGTYKGDDPIVPLAELIASESRLLCFDELQVTDIADAMILGRLFEALFERGVVLAVTSNRAPDQLYLNGINRQLFLPFVNRITERCDVLAVAGARDWRLDRLAAGRLWFATGDPEFETLWADLRGDEPEEPTHLVVLGRDVMVERTAGGMARAGLAELCGRALGPQDYLAIAERFHTLFLDAVPVLDPAQRNEARRFVTLVDALYEARVRLVVRAAAGPDTLYPAGDGAFEFERTASRLHEMTSADWLAQSRD
jgi:cell division protein ZapE